MPGQAELLDSAALELLLPPESEPPDPEFVDPELVESEVLEPPESEVLCELVPLASELDEAGEELEELRESVR